MARATFCRECGYDADLEGDGGEGYLDGVDLPQGYAREDGGEGEGYDETLRQEGLAWGVRRVALALVGLALAGLFLWVTLRR